MPNATYFSYKLQCCKICGADIQACAGPPSPDVTRSAGVDAGRRTGVLPHYQCSGTVLGKVSGIGHEACGGLSGRLFARCKY